MNFSIVGKDQFGNPTFLIAWLKDIRLATFRGNPSEAFFTNDTVSGNRFLYGKRSPCNIYIPSTCTVFASIYVCAKWVNCANIPQTPAVDLTTMSPALLQIVPTDTDVTSAPYVAKQDLQANKRVTLTVSAPYNSRDVSLLSHPSQTCVVYITISAGT